MITDLDYMLVQYSEELQLLRAQWKPGYSLQHLKRGLLCLVDVARQRAVSHIVLDLHHLPDIDVLDQTWISLTWFPKIVALPLQQVALVIPPRDLYNHMVVENILWIERSQIDSDIQFFSETKEALLWITAESPLLPAFQCAWNLAYGQPITV